ncbi:DUF29 domain-containing protein [Massilia solisilvae]|uniref:DUF29 domain-containing protein n=1 Tax=Massilia solisilvae TaxID=1811225 RepID=A0ABT2BMX3_9BURK|nr:DUF29 domain-containing protein [Massilia solisilvae]MCS0609864.1 DUF29 domain-containing protein [Massilia solisilvae]
MDTSYDNDVVAWASEQAALLRSGKLDAIDVMNIAEEIEGVAHDEQREFGRRFGSLLMHLLKWQYQTAWRCGYWRETIAAKRQAVSYYLGEAPSLSKLFEDQGWLDVVWGDAVRRLRDEIGLDFPEHCPWPVRKVLDDDFFPV